MLNHRQRVRPDCRRAMALLAVMVIILLVALAAYGFNQRMSDAYRISQTNAERTQARLAAASGIEMLLAQVERPRALRGDDQRVSVESLAGVAIEGREDEASEDTSSEWSFSVISPVPLAGQSEPISGAAANPWRFGLTNESAKLNLLALREWNRRIPGHARRTLMGLPAAEGPLVDAFLKAYGVGTARGAESFGRSSEIVDDLRQSGGTPATRGDAFPRQWAVRWSGGDWDCNYEIDSLEGAIMAGGESSGSTALQAAPSPRTTQIPVAWRDFLTFYSGQRNENRSGQPRIFLNDTNLLRLHRRLVSIWPEEWANFVIAARQFGLAGAQGGATTGQGEWLPDFSRAPRFLIGSPLDLIGAQTIAIDANGEEVRLLSPLSPDVGAMGDYLGGLVDDVTVDANRVIIGQIDVTEAPSAVLRAIPGISESTVDTILQRRGASPPGGVSRETVAWLVLEEAIDLPTLKQLFPWITVGGDCYSAQVIGLRDSTSPLYRCTVIVDGRTRPAQVRNLQQWHSWGRGFSLDALLGENEMLGSVGN